MDWVIMLLFAAALVLRLVDRKGILTLVSAALVILGCAGSLLLGAGVWECAGGLLVFLLLNMGVRE